MLWYAMLGVINFHSLGHSLGHRLGPGRVGPISIVDPVYGLVPSRGHLPFWACTVQGEVTATEWSGSKAVEAATQARLVASLISLAYEPGVQLLTPPTPNADQHLARFEERQFETGGGVIDGAVSIVGNSWDRLEGLEPKVRELLKGALLMFHEGLLLRDKHPSLALVAFVAAVEAVGQVEKPPDPRCPVCGFKKGAHRAYKSVLERVGFKGEFMAMAEETYSEFRSPTVHSAVLHGHEFTSGVQTVELHASEAHAKASAFVVPMASRDVGQLWLMEQACAKVLRFYLLA